jgi:glyoxylase-like metal-dependent hydrolase (beta-lactamase superfamily II)
MSSSEPVPGLYRIPLMGGFVAAYLLAQDGELTLVDTGPPGSLPAIEEAVRAAGLDVGDLTRIVVTHAHADHSGSAAAVRERTGAPILMSAADARLIASGWSSRGLSILPGQEATLPLPPGVTAEVLAQPAPAEPFDVDTELAEGSVPGVADLEAIATPGHCEGQMSLLWRRQGGVLLCGDAAGNFDALAIAAVGEDFDVARDSARRHATRDFEVAVFGHGEPLTERASARFRETFSR